MKPLNHNGEARTVLSFGGMQRRVSSWFGPLHPLPTCKDCPQYGQAIIFERKCYYTGPQCVLPPFLMIRRLRLRARRIENKAKARITAKLQLLGWEQ